MSDTQIPPAPSAPPAPPTSTQTASSTTLGSNRAVPESLKSQAFIIAILLILTLDGTITAIFIKGSSDVIATQAGLVIGGILGAVTGYFFGASKHPPTREPPPPATVTNAGTTA